MSPALWDLSSWRGEPVNDGELIRGPDGEDDEEDKAGEIDGTASAEAGVAADEDHGDVGQPHGEGEQDFGIEEVRRPDSLLGNDGADKQAGSHAGQAEEQGFKGNLVGGFERREPGEGGGFPFEAALLNEVQERGEEREK